MRIAVTRDVSAAMQHCELSYLARSVIDIGIAREQHQRYAATLAALGCTLLRLPELPEQADSVFVEDTAVVLDEVAVITRPGAESRRAETEPMAQALAEYRHLRFVSEPATLDGGDVLCIGRSLYVGLSGRSNRAGVEQLAEHLRPFGYTVQGVQLTGCLHLKTAATLVAPDRLLINPQWADKKDFRGVGFVEVDPTEPPAGNAVLVGEAVVYPKSFPRTAERLSKLGLDLHHVDMSETEKAEGGVTCCSLIFKEPAA